MGSLLRTVLVVLVGLGAAYLALDRVVAQPGFKVPTDFVQYWAAGAINLRGGNPYDPAQLLAWQRLADPGATGAVMMWNPPWSLAVYMPLGWFSPRWAAVVWVGLQIVAVGWACAMLWRVFDGPARLGWAAPIIGLTFVGSLWTFFYGQNTGFLLLGLAGFAYHRKAGRAATAGAFAALTALKPHLLAVFGVLLVLDAADRRGRTALLTGGGAVAASLGIALLANPAVVGEYRAAVRDPGPTAVSLSGWALPVASYHLRMAVAPDRFWVQFVPCGLVCLGYAGYRLARGRRWDWTAELPGVVWASVLATPYGGWVFDLAVLLVPVVRAAVWVASGRRVVAGAALAAGLLTLPQILFVRGGGLHEYGWVAPAVLGLYLAAAAVRARGPGPGAGSYDNGGRDGPDVQGRRRSWWEKATRGTGW